MKRYIARFRVPHLALPNCPRCGRGMTRKGRVDHEGTSLPLWGCATCKVEVAQDTRRAPARTEAT